MNRVRLIGAFTIVSIVAIVCIFFIYPKHTNNENSSINESAKQKSDKAFSMLKNEDLKEILDDPSSDEFLRKHAAIALVRSEKGVFEVIRAIEQADRLGQDEFKDELLQALATLDSVNGADLLALALTGEQPSYGDTSEISQDLRSEIETVVRKTSDRKAVGEMLTERYISEETTEEAAEQLENIQHPVMYSNLAADAYERGDEEEAAELMDRLAEMDDPGTINAIMRLADDDSIPMEDVVSLVEQWIENHPDSLDNETLAEYLSDPGQSPAQRALAAQALASSADYAAAQQTLQKASENEENEQAREAIDEAIQRVEKISEQESTQSQEEVDTGETTSSELSEEQNVAPEEMETPEDDMPAEEIEPAEKLQNEAASGDSEVNPAK